MPVTNRDLDLGCDCYNPHDIGHHGSNDGSRSGVAAILCLIIEAICYSASVRNNYWYRNYSSYASERQQDTPISVFIIPTELRIDQVSSQGTGLYMRCVTEK